MTFEEMKKIIELYIKRRPSDKLFIDKIKNVSFTEPFIKKGGDKK